MRTKMLAAFCLLSIAAGAQYKNDNLLFKTIEPQDLCAALQKNNRYLILDVRTKGEYDDTSATRLNIGHLKGALNIHVQELGTHLDKIKAYGDQPVFVYCTHSQRSRRASKLLADSGFTNVYNINGGMAALYYTDAKEKDCLQSMIVSNNEYAIISPNDLCKKLSGKSKDVFVLDVRSDSAFHHITTDAKVNAYGYVRDAVDIPLADLEKKLSSIPRDKEIIVTDLSGKDAPKAAKLLTEKGYKKVSVLIEGIDRWLIEDESNICRNKLYVSPVDYTLMSSVGFGRFAQNNKDYLLLDVREKEDFNNQNKNSGRNIGHLKNAVNIPAAEINNRIAEIANFKKKPVIIYSFSGDADTYRVANTLHQNGFNNVNVLVGGLFDIRWTAANMNDQSYLKDFVTDIPADNL
jgi:rhodanese-related sulfurtransferase